MPAHPSDDHRVPRRTLLRAGAWTALAGASATAAAKETSSSEDRQRPGREIGLASLTLEGIQSRSRDETIGQVLQRMEQAASIRPDLICLPETFNGRYQPRPSVSDQAEPLDGPTVTAIAAFAKAKRTYVVAPITLSRAGKFSNTAVLLDRNGRVAGTYDKIHPTEKELSGGITPGREAPVFTTDFGKIGIQICFDIDWPDGWRTLADKGAELVVWPAAYPGGFPLNALAWTHRYPIITSPWTTPAALIDLDGQTLARSGTWEPWIARTFCLDRGLFHLDFHLDSVRKIERIHGRDVTVRWSHDENAFVLENRIPGRTLADLSAEFGLVPLGTYLARAREAQERARRS